MGGGGEVFELESTLDWGRISEKSVVVGYSEKKTLSKETNGVS